MITNFIQLDFNKENDLKVPSVQYDSGSRFVKIKLQRNKSPFEIDGYRVTVVANKVDGTEIMNDCTILDGDNGLVQFEITEQFNAVEGVVDCQLKLFKGKTLLTSMPFSINVVKSVSTKEIVSSNELKTLVNALGEVQDIDNRFAQTNAQLSVLKDESVSVSNFYASNKIDKKIVMIGDSTTEVADAMYDRFDYHINESKLLSGCTVINCGSNGNTLTNFINGISTNGWNINTVLSRHSDADIYVISYGINDVRGGELSPAHGYDEIMRDLRILIDKLLTATSAYIILRIPNTFLSSDPTGAGTKYLDDIKKAQEYSDILYRVYNDLSDYSSRVDVIDMPVKIFGKKCVDYSPFVKDTLHPSDIGYCAIADELANRISNKRLEIANSSRFITRGYVSSLSSSSFTATFLSNNLDIKVGDVVVTNCRKTGIVTKVENSNYDYKIEIEGQCELGFVDLYREDIQVDMSDSIIYSATPKNGGNETMLTSVIYHNLTGVTDFEISYDVLTTTNDMRNTLCSIYANNSANPNTIVGGANSGTTTSRITLEKDRVVRYRQIGTVDFTDTTVIHLLFTFANKNNGVENIDVKIKNIELRINDVTYKGDDIFLFPYNSTSHELIQHMSITDKKDWLYINAKPSSTLVRIFSSVDLSQYSLNDLKPYVEFDYNTDDSNIKSIYSIIAISDNPTTFNVANVSAIPTTQISPIFGKTSHYRGFPVNETKLTNYGYLHFSVCIETISSAEISVAFGNVKVRFGEKEVVINSNEYKFFSVDTNNSQMVLKNAFNPEKLLTFSDLINYNMI